MARYNYSEYCNYTSEDPDPSNDFDFFETPPRKKRSPLIPCIAAIAIFLLIGGALLFLNQLFGDGSDEAETLQTEVPATEAPLWTTAPETEASDTTENLWIPAPETEPAVPDHTESVPEDTEWHPDPGAAMPYYYSRLNSEQQTAYGKVLTGLAAHDAEIPNLLISDYQDLYPVIEAVRHDQPQIFWFTGKYSLQYTTSGALQDVTVTPEYFWDAAQSEEHRQFVEQTVRPFLDSVRDYSDYEKQKAVYEYLIDSTIYDYNYRGRTIYEVFHDNRSVCAGYADASKYLLDQLGVPSIIITGDAVTPEGGMESHAWNLVQLDGEYYHMDTTWGDPLDPNGVQSKNFNYLNLTDDQISLNHIFDRSFFPACTATTYNYFLYEGKYLTFLDLDTLGQWLRTAYASGAQTVSFRVSDANVFADVLNMFSDGTFYKLMTDNGIPPESVTYIHYDDLLNFTILMP